MDLNTLIYKTRSIRRFQQSKAIDDAQMRYFIDMARLAPSGGNIQPLKYFYSNKGSRTTRIFETRIMGRIPERLGGLKKVKNRRHISSSVSIKH
ncbi:MAG: nitroreductase family protein [Bacteroidales bacterium]|nr:nitroreductase family protein [Bacteroidales bacterium]